MKEETRIEKQRKLEEIKDKYKPYFDLLSNCGGALPLRDFSILLDKTRLCRYNRFCCLRHAAVAESAYAHV